MAIAEAASLEALLDAVGGFDAKASKFKSWAKGTLSKTESSGLDDGDAERFLEEIAELQPLLRAIGTWNPAILRPAFRLLHRLLGELRGSLRSVGVVTYFDLLAETRLLLQADEGLRQRIRQTIDQLLVDEVQDTDPIQYDIVRMLALEGEERPGLFLVGDPKQSIYAFRSADLGAYEDFIAEVEAEGGLRRPLVVNFRSDPPILDEVERLLEPIMLEEPRLQPAFQKLLAAESKIEANGYFDDDRRPVEYWNSWLRDPDEEKSFVQTRADDARRIEAEAIAADMRALHEDRGLPYRSMAILLRATTQQETYLRALRDADVPYLVEKDRQFYRRREVMDASSLLVCVLDAHDHLALLGWLRSSAVGLPDAALMPLWRAGFPGEMSALTGPDPQRIESLDRIVEVAAATLPTDLESSSALPRWTSVLRLQLRNLAKLRGLLREEPADVFLAELRSASGLELRESARFLGAHRLANLERFHRMALDRWREREVGAHEIVRELLRGISEERDEAEGSPGDESTDAVRVMSVHKAKGLDFDHVYLAALHQGVGSGPDRRPVQVEREGDRREFRLFGAETPGFTELARRHEKTSKVEAVRNLYVAVTRAAKRVVMTGRWPKDEADLKSVDDCRSPLDLIRRRSGGTPNWEQLGNDDLDGECRDFDDDGLLWKLPDFPGREPERHARAQDEEASPLPRLDIAEIQARQEARRKREAEKAVTAASSLADHDSKRTSIDVDFDDEEATLLARDDAKALGTALHLALELWPRERQPADWLRELADDPDRLLSASAGADLRDELARSLRALADSEIAARLEQIADSILARELPCVLAREEGLVVGSIDLLHRDEENDELVVVDFKSDRVGADAEAIAARYREQGQAYVDAANGSGLKGKIRFEVWFLKADLIIPMATGA